MGGAFCIFTREIFKNYYKKIGWPIPAYFPTEIINDLDESAMNMWQDLYLSQKDKFKYAKLDGENVLIFDMSSLDKSHVWYQDNAIDVFRNSLPISVCVKGKGSRYVKLKADNFLEWINVYNPYKQKHQKIWTKLLHINQS